jgi:DNA invertase Pin-like site-specific DNA recombinase
MMMQMLGSFAEFEREMIRERTRAGLREARTQGRVPGRKPKIIAKQRKEIVDAVSSGRKVAKFLGRFCGDPMNMIDQIAHAIAEADGSDFQAEPASSGGIAAASKPY